MTSPTIAVGTDKGLFLLKDGDEGWSVEDPQFLGWRVTALGRSGAGTFLAGTASGWFGPSIHRSTDLRSWEQVVAGPAYTSDDGAELEQIWRFHDTPAQLLCGVAHAGLFRSFDDGVSWEHVRSLRGHPTVGSWMPGAGGLCAHAILHDPGRPERIWVGISSVGVFRSDDGGDSWELRNDGVTVTAPDPDHDIGYCVHGLALDPDDSSAIYRQEHRGLFRTEDGGDSWLPANEGVPSTFGFPIVIDASSGHLFVVPQASDEHRVPIDGALSIYRSTDRARSWQPSTVGLPDTDSYAGVLRGAMASDDAGTVAFGTTSGELYVSRDSGDSWERVDTTLPRIFCVEMFDEG